MAYTVAAFYRFFSLPDPAGLREAFRAAFEGSDLRGTMLFAPEGVNGTMAGSAEVIARLVAKLSEDAGLDRSAIKFSTANEAPFKRLKFKLKREIITFRDAPVDPAQAGTYVAPQDWNALLDDPAVLVLDTRNRYEVEAGTFAGAVDPGLSTFSDFATYVREHLDPGTTPKVAMFCTGGIRCEKASAFMLQQGFAEVFHLQGGILRYLEEVPWRESQWKGSCYIFDNRVTVDHESFRSDG